jgi:hypothetical protein
MIFLLGGLLRRYRRSARNSHDTYLDLERDTVITDGARPQLEFSLALVNYRVVKAAGQDQLAESCSSNTPMMLADPGYCNLDRRSIKP